MNNTLQNMHPVNTSQKLRYIPPSKDNTAAVIITYNPNVDFEQRLQSLVSQVKQICIVDNASNPDERAMIGKLLADESTNIVAYFNSENLGVAEGLNIGIKHCLEQGFDWVVTLDQDSSVSSDFLLQAAATFAIASQNDDRVVSISPSLFPYIKENLKVDLQSKEVSNPSSTIDCKYEIVHTCLTSGNILLLNVVLELGFFDKHLFIDHVDHDFCFKLNKNDYKIIKAINCVLFHDIGIPTPHKLFFKTFQTRNHTPLRIYYIFRNSLFMYARYMSTEPRWVLYDFRTNLCNRLLKILLWENKKIEKIRYAVRGIADAVFGNMGRIS